MSHADVVQFLKDFADRDAVSVWRPGLDDWKPASHLFDILAPSRLVSAPKEISSKRRYSLYGMYVGVSALLADYLFEWRGKKFGPWTGNGVAENIGHIIIVSYTIKVAAIMCAVPFIALSKRFYSRKD